MIKTALTFLIATSVTVLGVRGLDYRAASIPKVPEEMLYLPNGKGLQVLSFGYQAALSDILWINVVSYFGKHYAGDKNYEWLSHNCNLVTRLNPSVYEPYYFCATMLAWENNKVPQAIEILSKGAEAHPDDWYFFFQRGFYRFYFEHDAKAARDDFTTAASKPNAHAIAATLAARSMAELSSVDTAIAFVQETLRSARDANQRGSLEYRLNELYYERDLQNLERSVQAFKAQFGTYPGVISELKTRGLYNGSFTDPFGGQYQVDAGTGSVSSTSGKKRLSNFTKAS